MLRFCVLIVLIACSATIKLQAAPSSSEETTTYPDDAGERNNCDENKLDPDFIKSFEALPAETIIALKELEEELRLPDSEVGENESLIEMAVAEVLCHHIGKLPSERHFHLPFHRGKKAEMSDTEFLDLVWDEQVTVPCASVKLMYQKYGKQLNGLCGGARLGCQSYCPAGQFMDYYETCTRIGNLRKERVYAYANMIRKMKTTHKRFAALGHHHEKNKTA